MELVSDLRGAIDRSEIAAYYQPQVDVRTLEVVAVEALARWNHPDFGLVVPSIFIPLAEAHELIHEIGAFMIDEGTRRAAEWTALGLDIEVAINVSAAQLADLAFLDRLDRALEERAAPPEKIVIEITESLPLLQVDEVSTRLHALRSRGLGLSIDDFGTGYSTITHLAGIPATEMKIDKSLIQDADAAGAVLRNVIAEAHVQGLRVVAEGVETERHLATARELECDRAQGYLFGRPLPLELVTPALLTSARRRS
jgi:EAL domain-containing protein (putative c-di-GMP-specific phosphodiesterase class I)